MNQNNQGRINLTLEEAIHSIHLPDPHSMELAQKRWDSIAKPLGSLGLLEQAIVKIAGMTRTPQINLNKKCVVVMCADNGVVAEGVTQTTQDVTAVVTENFTKGETSVCKMAEVAGADVIPVDIGVASDVSGSGLLSHKIAYGTQNMVNGPAMTREQARDAVEFGINLACELKSKGYRMLATGEMGIGNTTTSSAVVSVLLDLPVETVTGRGAGLSSEGFKRKQTAIRRAVERNAPNPADPLDVLSKVGGFDLAGLTGIFLGGAVCGLPVVVDGFISASAALIAARLCENAAEYFLASHVSKEPAGQILLDALHLKPFLTCEMCLGEGTGAVAAFPILEMACAVYSSMSTFTEIEIDSYQLQK